MKTLTVPAPLLEWLKRRGTTSENGGLRCMVIHYRAQNCAEGCCPPGFDLVLEGVEENRTMGADDPDPKRAIEKLAEKFDAATRLEQSRAKERN